MRKYNKGDRVRVTKTYGYLSAGKQGEYLGSTMHWHEVKLDNPVFKYGEDIPCHLFADHEIEPVEGVDSNAADNADSGSKG